MLGPSRLLEELRKGADVPVIAVTSYGSLRRDLELLRRIQWNYVVLDEAHLIHNPRYALGCSALSSPAMADGIRGIADRKPFEPPWTLQRRIA